MTEDKAINVMTSVKSSAILRGCFLGFQPMLVITHVKRKNDDKNIIALKICTTSAFPAIIVPLQIRNTISQWRNKPNDVHI